jgi:hypothetical protein
MKKEVSRSFFHPSSFILAKAIADTDEGLVIEVGRHEQVSTAQPSCVSSRTWTRSPNQLRVG